MNFNSVIECIKKVDYQRLLINLRKFFIFDILVFIFGVLSNFSFAPYRLFWLMPLMLVLFLFIIELNYKKSIRLAFIWGFGFYLTHNYWIEITLNEMAFVPKSYSIMLTMVFAIYLALYSSLTFWLVRIINTKSRLIRLLVIIPIVWTISEYIRANLFTGFGWGEIGYTQVLESSLSGYAIIGGVHLITYLLILISALFTSIFFIKKKYFKIIPLVAIIVLFVLGAFLFKGNYTKPTGVFSKIALVQGNIPQNLKFKKSNVHEEIQYYYDQIELNPDVDLIVYPETAIPLIWQNLPTSLIEQFIDTAHRYKTDLAIGVLSEDKSRLYNAVIGVSDKTFNDYKKDLPFYAKVHLVPFGEYKPLLWLFGKLYNKTSIAFSNLTAGDKFQDVIRLANQYISFNICYEDGFGDDLIERAKKATLLANLSNMAWYGSSNAMDLQLQQSQTRALELGRYLIRATNNGKTAVISPKGKILALIPRDLKQTLVYEVEGYMGETPYMKLGGSNFIMQILSIILVLFWIGISRKRKSKN